MDTVIFYNNGSVEASTSINNASYVAMENGAQVVGLGQRPGGTNLFDGQMAGGPLGPFFTQKELTADDVRNLYSTGRKALGL